MGIIRDLSQDMLQLLVTFRKRPSQLWDQPGDFSEITWDLAGL